MISKVLWCVYISSLMKNLAFHKSYLHMFLFSQVFIKFVARFGCLLKFDLNIWIGWTGANIYIYIYMRWVQVTLGVTLRVTSFLNH